MPVPYQTEHRLLHDRFDTRRLADRVNERLTTDKIDARDQAFIESLDMFFIATVDRRGVPTCSYKGGDPGFVRVLNPHELGFPLYDGNGMFLTAGNLAARPPVGLLFIDFEHGRRLRIHGEAELDEGLAQLFPGALLAVRVCVGEVSRTAGATAPARGSSRSRRRSSAGGPAATRADAPPPHRVPGLRQAGRPRLSRVGSSSILNRAPGTTHSDWRSWATLT